MSFRPSPRALGYIAAWVGAAALAIAVGMLTVTSLGASARDRGPLVTEAKAVTEAQADRDGVAVADPGAARQSRTFDGDFGSFDVTCQGAVAFGSKAQAASGWRVVSFEEGPDDDIDAMFAAGGLTVELEVFCNRGLPEVSDREVKTLPVDD